MSRHTWMRLAGGKGLALAAVIGCARPVAAQAIAGRVVASENGQGLPAAVVTLLDSAGTERRAMLSDSAGRFRFVTPAPGVWHIRAQHIGRTTASTTVTLGPVSDASVLLEASIAPVLLQPLTVSASSECKVRPDARELTAQLWEEARKAFRVSSLARRSRWFVLRQFERIIDPKTGQVVVENTHGAGGLGGRPFGLDESESELNELGYVRPVGEDWSFSVPDDDILLSDGFLDHHCIEFQGGRHRPARGLVGIAFRPMTESAKSDIAGVVWLDAATAEVRSVRFHFTGLGWDVPDDALGGGLDFVKLRSGAIVTQRWYLRVPRGRRPTYQVIETGGELVDPEASGKPASPGA